MIAVGTELVTSLDNGVAAEICQTRSDTAALTRGTATADQSVTLLEISRSDSKRAVCNMRGRRQRMFL